MATFTSSKSKVEQQTVDQESKTVAEAPKLELNGVIGFNGTVQQGLLLHPADKHLISPLGSTIVVRDLITNSQTFLHKNGHNRSVSCLTLSLGGKYLASGQSSLGSFAQAPVVIWNMETFEIIHRLTLHKGAVQDLAFSPDEKFLATLGGKDDNKLVIWDVQTGEAICGAPAANDQALTVRFYNTRNDMLVTGGAYNLRVWQFDLANRKLKPTDCQAGQLKRVYTSVSIDEKDEFMFCGTKTGDLLQFNLTHKLFKTSGPKKPFSLGITTVMRTHKGNYVVGCGDGTVAVLKADNFAVVRRAQFDGAITSLALNAAGDHFFVGTEKSNVYLVHLNSFEFEVRNTCHNSRINDIAFPYNYSELFATCSGSDIRIWHSRTRNELLRIQVPNQECLCVCFTQDGRSILSGWADGKIRAFGPQTGKSQYVINDAHQEGVTAITSTKDSRNIISGGKQGQLRVWSVTKQTQKMTASMKEHKGCINSIVLNHNDTECVTASADGSCIVWNLERMVRSTCLFASTEFKQVVYQPDQSQLLTAGTDRKLTYWDVADGQPIRIVDGSTSEINSVAVSGDGSTIVSGGSDKLCKVWDYDEGVCKYIGIGHSSGITKVAISPDQQTIVSTGEEGSIFLFQMPSLGSNLSGSLENLTLSGDVKLPPMASSSSANGVPQQHQQQQVQAIAQSPKLPAIANTAGTRGGVSGKKLR